MPTYYLDVAERLWESPAIMFLRAKTRTKSGKTHRYFTVVENQRVHGGRVVQRQVLHLGELNDAQHSGWLRAIETLNGNTDEASQLALFPDDRDTERRPSGVRGTTHQVDRGAYLRVALPL